MRTRVPIPRRHSRKTEMARVERLRRKHERLQMLRALLYVWENHERKDPEYISELYRKIDKLQGEINVMAI